MRPRSRGADGGQTQWRAALPHPGPWGSPQGGATFIPEAPGARAQVGGWATRRGVAALPAGAAVWALSLSFSSGFPQPAGAVEARIPLHDPVPILLGIGHPGHQRRTGRVVPCCPIPPSAAVSMLTFADPQPALDGDPGGSLTFCRLSKCDGELLQPPRSRSGKADGPGRGHDVPGGLSYWNWFLEGAVSHSTQVMAGRESHGDEGRGAQDHARPAALRPGSGGSAGSRMTPRTPKMEEVLIFR